MPADLQRFGPLLEHEAITREQFADDPRLAFTSGLSTFNFGDEQRIRGPASTFSQIAMHYTELVINSVLDGRIYAQSVTDVQRLLLDPTPLEIAAGYKEALVEAALKMPRSLGVRFHRAGGLRGIVADVRQHDEEELKRHGPQPSSPFGNASGSRCESSI